MGDSNNYICLWDLSKERSQAFKAAEKREEREWHDRQQNGHTSLADPPTAPPLSKVSPDGTTLQPRGYVASCIYKQGLHGSGSGLVSTDDTDTLLRDVDTGRIERLDMSSLNMFEEDLPHITALLRRLPQCRVVSLAHNRIHERPGAEYMFLDGITEMLALPQLAYVNVFTNYCMDSARVCARYSRRSADELHKLVFLPPQQLDREEPWIRLLRESTVPDVKAIVERTHRKYYAENPTRRF